MQQGEGMGTKNLPDELISLIHHVELNESGWWKKSTVQIIKSILFDFEHPISDDEIKEKIKLIIGIDIPEDNYQIQISDLLSTRKVIKDNNKYSLSENERSALSDVRRESSLNAQETEAFFKKRLLENGLLDRLDAEECWSELKYQMVRSIRIIGANTYKLLNDGSLKRDHDWLKGFLDKYPEEFSDRLKNSVSELLEPENKFCRRYILSILNSYFFVEATQLKKETIKYIEKVNKVKEIKLILDTNFVFSILGLHDNPANKSAESIFNLTERIGGVKIKYYVLRRTLDELNAVISHQVDNIKRVRYSSNLYRAINTSQQLSGISAKFFDECNRLGEELSPDAYFEPYTKGLQFFLESKNIKVMEWSTVDYPTRQDVIDDISTSLNRIKNKDNQTQYNRSVKGYESIQHDVILWHAIDKNRNNESQSALEENCWGLTLDFSLIAFDKYKRKKNNNRLPVLMHPNNFIQLIRFWVPRDKDLSFSVMDVMKTPLLTGGFNDDDEKISLEIISKLSTYNSVDSISNDILTKIITDKALRSRIKDSDESNDVIIELIESKFAEVAEEYKGLAEKRENKIKEKDKEIEDLGVKNQKEMEVIEYNKNKEINDLRAELNYSKRRSRILLKNNKKRKEIDDKRKRVKRTNFHLMLSIIVLLMVSSFSIYFLLKIDYVGLKYQVNIPSDLKPHIKLILIATLIVFYYVIWRFFINYFLKEAAKFTFVSFIINNEKKSILFISGFFGLKDYALSFIKNHF